MIRIKDESLIEKYLTDESRIIKGKAEEVILVENENEIIEILKEANFKKIKITVSGAGTGITGSRVPLGGIIISMENFTRVVSKQKNNEELIEVNEGKTYSVIIGNENGEYYVKAPAGIPLKILKKIVEEKGLFYPPDPTETSSFIGGNIATNASGSRTFKYGSTRDYVRRIRIVLPTCEILDIRRGDIVFREGKANINNKTLEIPNIELPKVDKNAAGYYLKKDMDLVDLFIGSEGTLGIITEVELKLIKKPETISSIFAYFDEEINAINFAKILRKESKEGNLKILSIEFFDENSLNFIREKFNKIKEKAKGLIDFEIENNEKHFEKILRILEKIGYIEAYVVPLDEAKEIRYALPEKINNYVRKHNTHKVATDIVVPEDKFDEMYNYYHKIGKESKIEYVLFGHIGNFHLHFNFLPKNKEELEKAKEYSLLLLKKAVSLGGTISGEHGVGKKYYVENGIIKPLLELMYSKEKLLEIAKIKVTLDPNLILNIGNIIPEEYLKEALKLIRHR